MLAIKLTTKRKTIQGKKKKKKAKPNVVSKNVSLTII